MVGNTPTLQKSQLLKFYRLFIWVYLEKVVTLEVFKQFYEISHNDSKDMIRTHKYGNFAFLGKKCCF